MDYVYIYMLIHFSEFKFTTTQVCLHNMTINILINSHITMMPLIAVHLIMYGHIINAGFYANNVGALFAIGVRAKVVVRVKIAMDQVHARIQSPCNPNHPRTIMVMGSCNPMWMSPCTIMRIRLCCPHPIRQLIPL